MYQKQVAALLAAWNAGDLDGLDAVVAPTVIRRSAPSLDTSADNLTEFKQVITDVRRAFPDAKVTVEEIYFLDGRSFARWTFTGTHTGPGRIPATGKAVRIEGASLAHYQAGTLVEQHVYFDAFDLLIQLGLAPAPVS